MFLFKSLFIIDMKNTQQYNYFFSRVFQITFIYFTNWMLLLNALYYMGVLKRFQESILFVTITVAFLGAIMVYIYHRRIVLKNFDVEIKGHEYQILDLFCHQLPLIVLLIFYDPKIKADNLLFGVGLLLIYMIIFNPLKIYNFDPLDDSKVTNSKRDSMLNKFLSKKTRYYVSIFMVVSYFVLAICAIKLKIFN